MENNELGKKKSSSTILLLLVVIGLCTYIVLDKTILNKRSEQQSNNSSISEKNEDKNKSLDDNNNQSNSFSELSLKDPIVLQLFTTTEDMLDISALSFFNTNGDEIDSDVDQIPEAILVKMAMSLISEFDINSINVHDLEKMHNFEYPEVLNWDFYPVFKKDLIKEKMFTLFGKDYFTSKEYYDIDIFRYRYIKELDGYVRIELPAGGTGWAPSLELKRAITNDKDIILYIDHYNDLENEKTLRGKFEITFDKDTHTVKHIKRTNQQ